MIFNAALESHCQPSSILKGLAPKGHPKEMKTKSVEKNLIRMLLNRYEQFGVIGRPVNDSKIKVDVRYGLQLFQILDLDENKQILRTNCWSMYKWTDSLLRWNESDFGNIRTVRIFPSQIWTPDIKLYNFADERLREHRDARVVVSSNGEMLWVPQALFKSTCEVEITYFPFDTQICMLEFGSWTYDKTQMDILWWIPDSPPMVEMPYLDFSDYVPMIPCVLLSSLTLVVFWLPPESPAKMMLGMNIFVAFFVLLLLLAESTPSAVKNFPLIGVYFCLNMIMITLSTFLATLVIHLYFRGDRNGSVPFFLRRIVIEGIGRLTMVRQRIPLPEMKKPIRPIATKPPKKIQISSSHRLHGEEYLGNAAGNWFGPNDRRSGSGCPSHFDSYPMTAPIKGVPQIPGNLGQALPKLSTNEAGDTVYHEESPSVWSSTTTLERDVRELKKYVKMLVNRQKETARKSLVAMEWRTLAIVLDRLFFFIYITTIVIAVVVSVPRSTEPELPPAFRDD
ncbi:unnamed protein product [Heterobilharzia americana]|nr:unnamed protein product [Heterobilharzia americana]